MANMVLSGTFTAAADHTATSSNGNYYTTLISRLPVLCNNVDNREGNIVARSILLKKYRKNRGPPNFLAPFEMIEVVLNDRLGRKVRVKCEVDDTVGDLKKLVAAQTGTRPEKLRIQKSNNVYKDHITIDDYEIKDGQGLELFYN